MSPRRAFPEPSLSGTPLPRCTAWIGDIVGSRRYQGRERAQLQRKLQKLLDSWNNRYRAAILSRFVITVGDEFQGLLSQPVVIPQLIRDMETALPEVQIRVGIGHGALETPLLPDALGMDGQVWHAARRALELAKSESKLGGVFDGFQEWTAPLNGLARLLYQAYAEMTQQQRQIVDLMQQGASQVEAAKHLGKKQPAISHSLKSVGFPGLREGETAWEEILVRFARET